MLLVGVILNHPSPDGDTRSCLQEPAEKRPSHAPPISAPHCKHWQCQHQQSQESRLPFFWPHPLASRPPWCELEVERARELGGSSSISASKRGLSLPRGSHHLCTNLKLWYKIYPIQKLCSRPNLWAQVETAVMSALEPATEQRYILKYMLPMLREIDELRCLLWCQHSRPLLVRNRSHFSNGCNQL